MLCSPYVDKKKKKKLTPQYPRQAFYGNCIHQELLLFNI